MQGTDRYTRTAVALHWLIAALIIAALVIIWVIDLLPDDVVRPAIDTHKSLGLTVLGLAILRVLWRLTHRPPALPCSYPMLERLAAHAAHILLYALILGLPVSGWIHDSAFKDAAAHPLTLFGIIPWFRIGPIMRLDPAAKEQLHTTWFMIHTWLGYALYALLALHILAALKHQFIDKEPELARITHWRRPSSRTPAPGP